MAYDASKDQFVETAQVKKNARGDVVSVRKVSQDDFKTASIDVRLLEMGGNGELKFTSKGVRINSELGAELAIGILKCLDKAEVMDFMELANELTAS